MYIQLLYPPLWVQLPSGLGLELVDELQFIRHKINSILLVILIQILYNSGLKWNSRDPEGSLTFFKMSLKKGNERQLL